MLDGCSQDSRPARWSLSDLSRVASGFSRPTTMLGTAQSLSKGRKDVRGVPQIHDSRSLPPEGGSHVFYFVASGFSRKARSVLWLRALAGGLWLSPTGQAAPRWACAGH